MFYTIKQMAEQLGVTTNKLRYYESVGLIEPHIDEKTGYRHFSVRDTRRFNAMRLYRAFGLSIQDCKGLMNGNSHDALLDALDKREAAMQREIDFQSDRFQSLLFWKPFIAGVLQDVDKARPVRFPAVYRIVVSEDEVPIRNVTLQACFAQWLELFPVCTWASRIKQPVLEGNVPHSHDYGLLLPERFLVHYPHLYQEDLVEYMEGGLYVYTVFQKNTDTPFHLDGISAIHSYMEANGLQIGGDAFSNCIYSARSEGEIVNYHYFMVKAVPR